MSDSLRILAQALYAAHANGQPDPAPPFDDLPDQSPWLRRAGRLQTRLEAGKATQTGPFPDILKRLVDNLVYRPDWQVRLATVDRDEVCRGLTLTVTAKVPDSYHPEMTRYINHIFPVPAATYNEVSWRRWLFDRLGDVDDHERAEFFQIDGERPYAPLHGPGENPYRIAEVTTDEARRTSFRGDLNP